MTGNDPPETRALADHLLARVDELTETLRRERDEHDAAMRRIAIALGIEGDPMDEPIVARAEAVRREMERRRSRIERLRIALEDVVEDGDEAARTIARQALEADLDRRAA